MTRQRLNILILHANDDLARVRRTSFNHAFCLLKYAPWNTYELHSFGQSVTRRLRRERFDAILLDTTFLCWRWAVPFEQYLGRILRDYAFVADSKAIKVALPQDEYDHTSALDDWLASWRVDLIYSVCYAHSQLFYAKSSHRAEIVEGLTGYIDDADLEMMRRTARPFSDREIDVGYRARNLPPYFGRLGRMKAEIGEGFVAALLGSGFRLDISVDPSKSLAGDDWLRFLGNSRFSLGCESGSSLFDPNGDIRRACDSYLADHPGADFEEIEAACFPAQDMQTIFSAMSPRLLEAALAGTCQILVPGRYLGILQPDEHYIPLAQDFSNIDAVRAQLVDWSGARERAEACRAALLNDERLTYRGFVSDLLRRIEGKLEAKNGVFGLDKGNRVETSISDAERIHRLTEGFVATSLRGAHDLSDALLIQAVGTRSSAPLPENMLELQSLRPWADRSLTYRGVKIAWHAIPLTVRRAILRNFYT